MRLSQEKEGQKILHLSLNPSIRAVSFLPKIDSWAWREKSLMPSTVLRSVPQPQFAFPRLKSSFPAKNRPIYASYFNHSTKCMKTIHFAKQEVLQNNPNPNPKVDICQDSKIKQATHIHLAAPTRTKWQLICHRPRSIRSCCAVRSRLK